MKDLFELPIESRFGAELPADPNLENHPRQVLGACYTAVDTKQPGNPELLHYSKALLQDMEVSITDEAKLLRVMSGAERFQNFTPYAMCYGGHQFGHWAGQLGDGRAINIAELNTSSQHLTFQLKGSGPTPYSRRADGLAVLRSSIREYLCSEAMHHLGVPTTRALSLAKTGNDVPRDMLYDGHPADEHGAIVCRVAPSFIRFGNFEIFSSRQDEQVLKQLVDFTIKHHFPQLGEPSKETYLAFFQDVVDRTSQLMVEWQRVGFVHGVMNTDNLSILGLTIDYGPYGWLEDYDPAWTPNTTDAQNRRYRFGNQPGIGMWNLAQLGNALYPLLGETEGLQRVLNSYRTSYQSGYHEMMVSKLGLRDSGAIPTDFIEELTNCMEQSEVDMTLFFRELSNMTVSDDFEAFEAMLERVSYKDVALLKADHESWQSWYVSFLEHLIQEGQDQAEREDRMKTVNPKYVLRNYMAQLAIDAANEGDYSLVDELYQLLLKPYSEQPEMEKWYVKRPDWAKHKVGCSMLSCSS